MENHYELTQAEYERLTKSTRLMSYSFKPLMPGDVLHYRLHRYIVVTSRDAQPCEYVAREQETEHTVRTIIPGLDVGAEDISDLFA